jgi:hypothetical protein
MMWHNEELHNLYSSPNNIRQNKSSTIEVGRMWHAWERRNYRIVVGKPKGRRPLGRLRRRCKDGIRMVGD